jgi:phosphate:Na+ symporter
MRIFVLLFFAFLFSIDAIGQNQLIKPNVSDSVNFNGDNQFITSGNSLPKPIRAQVNVNNFPKSGLPVEIRVLVSPDPKDKGNLFFTKRTSNQKGIVEFNYTPGKASGEYLLALCLPDEQDRSNILIYKVTVRNSYWWLMVLFGLLGGLGLFLFGINFMSEGLQHSAGNKMRTILGTLTNNRFAGMGIGVFVTTIIQSSSATSVMLISFVDSGLMRFKQSIAVIIGAALGTTITIQLVALNASKYALAFVALGFLLSFFSKVHHIKHIGQIITGLGLLFLGLLIMSDSVIPLKTFQPVIDTLIEMENPIIGILAGIIFTAITQSASAFIGVLIILGQQGLLSLEASIPLLIGANVGTSVTAIIAAVGTSSEAKKVAFAHTAYRIFGALLIVWWIPSFADIVRSFSKAIVGSSASIPLQIANSHTLFYIGLTILSIPFTGLFSKLIDRIVPVKNDPLPSFLTVQFLDNNLLSTPSLALNLAKQETIRMANIVQDMTNDILLPFITKEPHVLSDIEKNERLVNFLRDQNTKYLLQISRQNVHEENTREAFQMMAVVKEIEQIADIISTNLLPKARYWVSNEFSFSDEGKKEIVTYHNLCQKQLRKAIEVFRDVNLEKAKTLKKRYKEYSTLALELEKSHFNRLVSEVEQSVGSSNIHIELLGMLNAITRHATNIARILLKTD